jgi:hypothetical protein
MEMLKRITQIKNWLRKLRRKVFTYATTIDNILYERNVTRRRFWHATRIILIIGYSLFLLIIGAIAAPYAWVSASAALPAMIQGLIRAITNFGEWLNLSSDFATILVAEIIAIFGSSVIARIFTREPKRIEPILQLTPLSPKTNNDGTKSYQITVSNEWGETGALECQATVTFNGIEPRDVLDVAGAKLNSSNFTKNVQAKLLWNDGSKQMTLRSGQVDEVEVLRAVPARDGLEAHFEIPSSDKRWKSIICLRLKTFYITVWVAPLNGKHLTRPFTIGFDHATEEWELS